MNCWLGLLPKNFQWHDLVTEPWWTHGTMVNDRWIPGTTGEASAKRWRWFLRGSTSSEPWGNLLLFVMLMSLMVDMNRLPVVFPSTGDLPSLLSLAIVVGNRPYQESNIGASWLSSGCYSLSHCYCHLTIDHLSLVSKHWLPWVSNHGLPLATIDMNCWFLAIELLVSSHWTVGF